MGIPITEKKIMFIKEYLVNWAGLGYTYAGETKLQLEFLWRNLKTAEIVNIYRLSAQSSWGFILP